MIAQDWDTRYASSELVWGLGPNRFLVQEIADLKPGRALDLGCGEGRNAIWLSEHGWDVTAVDFSEVGLAKARTIADERRVSVDWVRADLVDYVPTAGNFDLVIVLYLHLPAVQRRTVLQRARDALVRGGTILVIGHDIDNLSNGLGGPKDPAILYTPDAIAAELVDVEVERAARVTRKVTADGEERDAIDTLVRARAPRHGAETFGQAHYSKTVKVDAPFEAAVQLAKDAFLAEGFGTLTEIDVKATLKEKLDADVEPYVILGACNPPLARRALEIDPEIGLLLPCNVVIRAEGEETVIHALDPRVLVALSGRPELRSVADEAGERINRALAALGGTEVKKES